MRLLRDRIDRIDAAQSKLVVATADPHLLPLVQSEDGSSGEGSWLVNAYPSDGNRSVCRVWVNRYWLWAFYIVEILLFIYKSIVLPYPSNIIGWEIAALVFLCIIDVARLMLGMSSGAATISSDRRRLTNVDRM